MKVTIVNMIKASLSGEANNDVEPNIALNPANINQIAGTTFTPDPMGGSQGPIFISTDEGNTWDELDFLPTQTGDQTIRFGGNSNKLYAAILDPSRNMRVYSKNDITVAGLMGQIGSIPVSSFQFFDQPYIYAATVMGGSAANSDRVYVGGNDWTANSAHPPAAVFQSMDAGIAAPVFQEFFLDTYSPTRNSPQVRLAIHPDGTVYALFYSYTSGTSGPIVADVVIVRDDHWGNVAAPYGDLQVDPDPTKKGKKIATGVHFTFVQTIGNQRTAGNLSIAVDPRDSSTVYVAWAELLAGVFTTHLVRSTDRGVNWSADLLPISNATNPCLTINSQGKVGYLYQQVVGTGSSQRWETHFRSSDDGVSWDDLVLCSALMSPAGSFGLGDYTQILAAGKNFYGIFCADNTPDPANFPATATLIYNRNHNFVTKQLIANDGVTNVTNSVDPFFFKIEEMAPDKDFYVRDWTNNAGDHDNGQEPSTHPWFFHSSDVWNSNNNSPGAIVDDWYVGDQPTAGAGPAGDNFAFARISRNDGSSANTVHVDFLASDYGLGIPYASIGSQDINLATGELSKLTDGQPWHLDPSASTHVCLAAQIGTTGVDSDPFILPGLIGSTPGWPFLDLMVINDNNKAQRNLEVIHVATGLSNASFIRVRNAAMVTRDMHINWDVPLKRPIPKSRIEILGGESKVFKSGENIILKNMKPGENRWIAFTFDSYTAKGETELPIVFYEMSGNRVVNGCSLLLKYSSINKALYSTVQFQNSVFNRLNYGFGIKIDGEIMKISQNLLRSKSLKNSYLKHGSSFFKELNSAMAQLSAAKDKIGDISFGKEMKILSENVTLDRLPEILSAHNILLKKLDTFLTIKHIREGDLACILSNVRWQVHLYENIPALKKLKSTPAMLNTAARFIAAYSSKKLSNKNYPAFIKASIKCFEETRNSLSKIKSQLIMDLKSIDNSMNSIRTLERAHYNFLLHLNSQSDSEKS